MIVDDGDTSKTFVYKLLKKEKPILLERTISGKIEYFIKTIEYDYQRGRTGNMYMASQRYGGITYGEVYICEKGDSFVTVLEQGPRFKKFQKTIDQFFGDCKDVVSKIKADAFEQDIEAIPKIVTYYNENCN